jgi:hypothetical protein
MLDDPLGLPLPDEWAEFLEAGLGNPLQAAKVAQQAAFELLAHAGNRRQIRSKVAHCPTLAMVGDGIPVRLIADPLEKTKDG